MGKSEDELTDAEVTRLATRIYFSSFCQTHDGIETMDEVEIMKRHIRLCPLISPTSSVVRAALRGLEASGANEGNGEASLVTSNIPCSEVTVTLPTTIDKTSKAIAEPKLLPRNKRGFRIVGTLVRSIVLDAPLMLLFASYLFLLWVHRVHDLYLTTAMEALVWDDERAFREMTYYHRECDGSDVTAKHSHELFLPRNFTPSEAYEHNILHGMTAFPSILTEETAKSLRDFIETRSRTLKEEEEIYLVQNANRYSFCFGTEEPTVTKAISEIASNERLVSALEAIMGKNPALIEMTVIASSYGAVKQHFHEDVVAVASAMKYGRTFSPSYSLFVQLQDTTREMGASSSCPGTHMCAQGEMRTFCEDKGFQVVNADGLWRTGDGMLMNMNTWHRGAAHTDPNAPDRVMLILTFSPKPRTRAESRQMSQGITFSLRWDMWGHTLRDLARADTAMSQPWATLRALGLYKKPDAEWGIDYVTSAAMRISNEDLGFQRDDLDLFIAQGGFKLLPKFLHGEFADDESWREFLMDTLIRCETFLLMTNVYAVSGYVLFYVVICLAMTSRKSPGRSNHWRRFGWALRRIVITHTMVCALYRAANYSVDNTHWAKDLKTGRLYRYPIHNEQSPFVGPSTLPFRSDVLIETRYGSEQFAVYNDFISVHPGNRLWNAFLQDGAGLYESYSGLPACFREALAEYIVGFVQNEAGRFLYQDTKDSNWILLSTKDAIKLTKFELKLIANPVLQKLRREIRFLLSECKYGHLRDTAMANFYAIPLLNGLHSRLFEEQRPKPPIMKVRVQPAKEESRLTQGRVAVFRRTFELTKIVISPKHISRHLIPNLHVGMLPEEPQSGAWIQEGDMVEVSYEENGRLYWYKARVLRVSSSAYYLLQFEGSEEEEFVTSHSVRRYIPPVENERVEVQFEEETYYSGVIVNSNADGTFDVYVKMADDIYKSVDSGLFRRRE